MFRSLAIFSLGLFTLAQPAPIIAVDTIDPAPEGSFSIVVIPDTQAYRGKGTKAEPDSVAPLTNEVFDTHVRWIADNIESQNIVFVSHVGDIVDKNIRAQWEVARACMDRIHGKVPYGISVGNHDMTSAGDSSLFQEYFPASRYAGFPWYGGAFVASVEAPNVSGNNANSFQLFSAGGRDFVFLHLECNAPDDVLDWADGVLEAHSDRIALFTSHMGWGPLNKPTSGEEFITGEKGRMAWLKNHGTRGNTPQQLWEKCYRKHPHLRAVFSGDQSRTQAIRAATPGDHGNDVHELLQDYSTGWLRIYRFLPGANRVRAITFDSGSGALCEGTGRVPDRSQHQFEIEFSF